MCGSKWSKDILRLWLLSEDDQRPTCVSQGLACVPRLRKEEIRAIHDRTKAESRRPKEKRLTNLPTEDHGRQKHLGSPISNSLHQKVKL